MGERAGFRARRTSRSANGPFLSLKFAPAGVPALPVPGNKGVGIRI
jgi:hypothetical protein